ncbi:MAG: calcium-binding protein, partial [Verrucomicrobia bacterium]|nr:calcium-binding protein [Verrucomicrobiota bacterium]
MQRRSHARFELEALEPRLLLSADGLSAGAPVAPVTSDSLIPIASEQVIQATAEASVWTDVLVSSDPALNSHDIFQGLPDLTEPLPVIATEPDRPSVTSVAADEVTGSSQDQPESSLTPDGLASPAAATLTERGQDAATSASAETVDIAWSGESVPSANVQSLGDDVVIPTDLDAGNPLTVQLTETLRAANGPPVTAHGAREALISSQDALTAGLGEAAAGASFSSLLGSAAQDDSVDFLLAILAEATGQWAEQFANASLTARLGQVRVEIADLPGQALAEVRGEVILLDTDAAGLGWFIDLSPADSSEFRQDPETGLWLASGGSPADGKADLLSVLVHELGHVIGFEDIDLHLAPAGVMTATLSAGQRRLVGESGGLVTEPAFAFGTISGANLLVGYEGGGAPTNLTPTVPAGDLESVVASTAGQATEVTAFFQGADGDGQVTFNGTMTVAGQSLTGTFFLKLESGQVLGEASSVTASLMSGDAGVRMSGGSGEFVLTGAGTALSIEGMAGFVNMPGLTVSGTLAVRINTLGTDAPASFGFTDNVNAFEGSPNILILGSDDLPIIDINGAVSIADDGTGVLFFNYADGGDKLSVAVSVSGIELFALEGTGQFTLGGTATASPGFQLVTTSLSATCSILGVGVTYSDADDYFVGSLGPLELKKVAVTMSKLNYVLDGEKDDGVLGVEFKLEAGEAKLAWGGDGDPEKQTSIDFCILEWSFGLDIAVDGTTGRAGAVSFGGFTLHSDTMDIKKPGVFSVNALEPTISYNPNWTASTDEEDQWGQQLLLLSYVNVKIDPIDLQVVLSTIVVEGQEIPALQVFEHGFKLGRGKVIITGDHSIGPLKMTDPFVQVENLWFVSGTAFSFSGTISAGAKSMQIGQTTGVFSLTATGNEAGDPGVKVTLLFTNNIPSGFEFLATTITANSDFLRLTAANVVFNARTRIENHTVVWDVGANEQMMYFGSLTATLVLGTVEIGGTASKFMVMGNGAIVPDEGFSVSISVGQGTQAEGATSGLKWPSWLPIKSAEVGVIWPDFQVDPTDMRLDLSIDIDTKIGTVTLGGKVEHALIDLKLLKAGKFPVVGVESASITAGGKLFGADIAGTMFVGLIRLDADGRRIFATDYTTPVADTVFYGGIGASITLAGKGFNIKLGVSELGPLQVYLSADIPIVLEPTSGLTLYGFRGGVAFNATPFPAIDTTSLDTIATDLRSPRFKPTAALTDDQWKDMLEQQVVNQVGGQFGYLFSLQGNKDSSIQAHVDAMNSAQTILDDMGKAFTDRGMPMSTLYASVAPVKLDWAWTLDYLNERYLVEKREIASSSDARLDITRVVLTLVDTPPPTGGLTYTALLDAADGLAAPEAVINAFAAGGIQLSASATVHGQTTGEKWKITDHGTEYLIAWKGTDDGTGSTGNAVLIVTKGGGSTDGFNPGTIRIEAGATLGFQSVPQEALKGTIDMILEITPVEGQDPQVKFLISGSLIFADPDGSGPNPGKLTATAKIFADLSNVSSGSVSLYFLMDVPETPRVFSLVGLLTMGFIDADGNTISRGETETQAEFEGRIAAYQIAIAGKAELTAAGFLGVEFEGSLTMTFSPSRFELAFEASISIEGIISADSIVTAAGIIVVDNQDDFEMWGLVCFNVSSSSLDQLADIGISFEADVILQLNIGGPAEGREVQLMLPGRDADPETTEQDPHQFLLPQNYFALFMIGDATFCPPGGLFSLEMTGAFSLELNKSGVRMFLLASFEFEVLEVPIMEFEALGLMAVVIDYDAEGKVTGGGFAARFELARRMDIALLDFEVEFQLYINTLGEEVVYELPLDFGARLCATLPTDLAARIEGGKISVPAGPPRLAGLFLAGVESGYVTSLDGGSVPTGLKTKFQDNGCKLMSSTPSVATLVSGTTWLVTDQVTHDGDTYVARYLVEKTEGGTGLVITSQMFVTDSTDAIVAELDGGTTIPDSIEQLFSNADLTLATNADLSVVTTGTAWIIESGANRYLLEKHGSKLLIMQPRAGPAGFYLIIAGGGHLTLLDTFTLEGRFRIQASTTGFEMDVYAGLELGILGHLRAAGTLSITKEGLVAALDLELEAGLPLGPNVGIDIEGKFALAINTTGAAVNLNVPTVGGGTKSIQLPKESVQIHVEGSFNFIGFITAEGWIDIFLSSEQFTFEGHISFALSNAINASADVLVKVVYTDNNNSNDDGVVIYADVSLDVNLPSPAIPIFRIDADGTLEVNTTQSDYTYQYTVSGVTHSVVLEKKSFLLDLNGELSVLGVLKLDAGFKIQVGGGTFTHSFSSTINNTPFGTLGPANYSQTLEAGDWAIGFTAELSFFGLATLGASGWLNSGGNFDIRVAGELVIGTRSFGLIGEFHFRVWLNETEFGLRVGASVGAKLFGITLASIGFDASFTASRGENSSGKVSIDLSVTVQIKILFVKIEKTATFHVGTLQLPPVPNLASKEADGTLRLNTGTRANLRGVAKTEVNETYYIEHVAPQTGDPAGERIRVTAFGYSEEYTGITKIVGDGGSGNDVFIVRPTDTNDDDLLDSFVGVPVEFYGGDGDDVLVYDGGASSGTILLNGGDGSNYLEVGENCAAAVQLTGGSGADQLIHRGSGAGTLSGGGGGDQIIGGSGPDTITGGDGDDEITGNGGIDKIDAGAGNDTIYWKTGDSLDVGLTAGSPVTGGSGTDTFHYTGTDNPERFRVSVSSGNLLVQTLNTSGAVTETFTAAGMEKLHIDAAGGADQIEVNDLTGTAIAEVKVDLGLVVASSRTVIVGQDLDGDGEPDTDPSSGRLLAPEEVTVVTFANDNAADLLTIHGRSTAADNLVVYTDTTWLLEGQTLNEVRVKRAADTTDTYLVYNGLRNSNASQTDRVVINTAGGDDRIDASGVDDADLLVLELVGGAGNDTLIGSPYADVLDSGLGNDTVTGGPGTDTFLDAGGTDTLVEAQDKDLALFGNRFVAGKITNLYGTHNDDWVLRNGPADDVWDAGAEVEDITGGTGTCLFEEARISGGANSNILVVGDRNNSITVGGTAIAVTPWTSKVTLDNKTNSGENLAPEKYILNLTGTGTGNVWIEDSGGSVGSDTLWIFGTSAADNVTLDKQTIGSVVYGKVLVQTASASGTDTVYYREIENFAVSTLGGDDVLQLNDNLNTTHIYTGAGADSITIGYVATVQNDEDVPVADLANTTNGVSAETFIYGGTENDRFEINHNLAVLWLYGEDGDDRFVQYSFLVDLNNTTLPLSGEDDVTLNGGSGSNEYQIGDPGPLGSIRYVYLQNNLVYIEGGNGTDTFVIVGSPLADYFILTPNYLLGGGLNTTFSGIEVLELDTGAGDDVVYVLGSSATMDVSVVTGSGNDIVHVGGEAPAMKVVLPAHLVTPDPVLRQDMRKIYPFYTHPAFATTSTFSGTDNLAAPVYLDWVVDGTAHYHWYYPSGVNWNTWKSGVVSTYSTAFAAVGGRHYQTQLPVDAYAGYSFLSTTGETTYLQSALNGVRLDQTTRNWQWDDRAWNQHQYVYYTAQFNYTFPAVTYVDQVNWRYMAPYVYSPPTTEVPCQEYWVMLPKVDTLTGFDGKVTVDGGSSTYEQNGQQVAHTDQLFVHNENGAASTDGHLSATSLTGLGLSSNGIQYSNFEELDLRLGANNDSFAIDGTHAGKTDVVLGAGNDSVTVNALGGETNILGGAGADTVTVQGNSTSGLSGITAKLHFFGNAHRYETSTGTGVFQPVATLDSNGLPVMEWIQFTQLPQSVFTDAAVFNNTGAILEGQTQWQYGTQQFDTDNRTPLLQSFTVKRQQVATTSTELRQVTTHNTTVTDSSTDRLVVVDSASYTVNTTGVVSSSWVTGIGMAVGIQYEQLEDLSVTLGGGADTLTITGLSTPAQIHGGPGSDIIHVVNGNQPLTVNGDAGADVINIQSISAVTTVNGGAENDTVNVGCTAGATPATAGNVNGISALLTVNGDGHSDTLNVDDTSDTAANPGTLTGTQLIGLGMSHGITYGTLETVNINLGSGGDTFTVESTHVGTTTVNSNAGQDTVRVESISGATNVNTAADRDTVNVWNDSDCLDDIDALLTVNLGDPMVIGAGDHLDVRDRGNTTGRSGTLTASTLSGLGMGGSINYSAVELLDLSLGSGPDILRIKSTSAVTNVTTGAGDDQINVWNDTNQLAGIAQVLTIDAGDPTASDTLTISDTGTSATTTGT